jgi:NifU-like protein involved in Fe-S cluster formation
MASILTEFCLGKDIKEIESLEDKSLLNMVGFPIGPNRSKCVLLPLYALHNALTGYLKDKNA